jgi:DNA-binding beta-propeller fold protein YncE
MKLFASCIAMAAALSTAAACAAPSAGAESPPYRVGPGIKTVAQGSIQAFRADAASRRLFIAGQGVVDVVDLDTDKRLGQVDIAGRVSAIALAPELNLGFAATSPDNAVVLFDLKTLKTVKTVPAGANPMALEYEPKTKRLFVSTSSGKVTVIDVDKGTVAGSVAVGGRLRGMAADTRGHLFVADEERNVVHVVDVRNLKVNGNMPTWPASGPTALLLDNKERRVYVATSSGRMVVLDPDIGQMVGHVAIGKGDSGIAAQFLPNRLVRMYVPTSDGQLTVVQNKKLTASVETTLASPGARGIAVAVDEKTGKAYLAGPNEVLVVRKGGAENVALNK